MTERHLAPDELQLLVDGEGVDSTRLMHLERCAHCRGELEAQRRVVALLESLPRFQPAPLFTYRVIATRAASICRFVIQAGSSAWIP